MNKEKAIGFFQNQFSDGGHLCSADNYEWPSGRYKYPGKFEGETILTVYCYFLYMDGSISPDEEFMLTPEECEVFEEEANSTFILEIDDLGFVTLLQYSHDK